jgi:transposase
MQTAHGNLHLEIQTSRKNPVGILRTTYRENGKVTHSQHGRITGCTLEQLKLLQLAFRGEVLPKGDPQALQILQSKEYGASAALLKLAKQLGLHRVIYSRTEPWVNAVLAMIVGRVIFAGSKLSLCHQHKNSSLWEVCGIEETPDVEMHCYQALDRLLERQRAIQMQLGRHHLKNGHLVLYDITSSYFEGEYSDSELVTFGYNRDGKKAHEQVVIGLVCSAEGCPVGIEVYPGNTKDSTTVIEKIQEIKKHYAIENMIFVGDRGMLTKSNLKFLQDEEGLRTITALTHADMVKLLQRKVIERDLFDDENIHEVIDPDQPQKRYCLCRNPQSAQRESVARQKLVDLTCEGLRKIAQYKQKTTVAALGARVGKLLAKYGMGKFIHWEIQADETQAISSAHRLEWHLEEQKIADEQRFDGCYIVTTDVIPSELKAAEVVAAYRKLSLVEQAFRNLKTVQLEVRPVYHKKDDRIRAHIFLCMLAYYLQWHIEQRLAPLFASDGKGKDREWTFRAVMDNLRQVTRNKIRMNGIEFYQNSELTEEQKHIVDLLQVAL